MSSCETENRPLVNASNLISELRGRGHSLQKTKSSDSIPSKAPLSSRPAKLSKTKSSTFISPAQSENIMYNSKVTLTLRRSRQNLAAAAEDENKPAGGGVGEVNEESPLSYDLSI